MGREARYEGYTAHAAHEAAVTLFLLLLASDDSSGCGKGGIGGENLPRGFPQGRGDGLVPLVGKVEAILIIGRIPGLVLENSCSSWHR